MAKIDTKEIYQNIVDKFKKEIVNGNNPFNAIGEMKNISTNRSYSGFNRWHLGGVVKEFKYSSGNFATYKQISTAGGQVNKGEKGFPVFFWGTLFIFRGDIAVSANTLTDATKLAKKKKASITESDYLKKTMFLKSFKVFNLDQQTGAEFSIETEIIEDPYTKLSVATQATLVEGVIPIYDIEKDELTINTSSVGEATQLKTFIKSTAHDTRLNRELEYAEEELVAAIGSSFLASFTEDEIVGFNASIIEHWLKLLDEKPMFLYKASSQAQKACDFLLDNVKTESEKAVA